MQKDDSYKEKAGDPEVMAALQQRQAEITKNEFMIELGFNFLKLVESEEEVNLEALIRGLRKEIPDLPAIRIVDNVQLEFDEYYIHWKDIKIVNHVSAKMPVKKQFEKIISDLKKVFEEGK